MPEPTGIARSPIGVFDSGVGGLAVLRELRAALPGEDLLYVADSAFAPYGEREGAFIAERAETITRFLLGQGARAIVIACNTASVVAVRALRTWCPVPVVAMEPAIKPAAIATTSGRIAVLATRHTVASESVARLVAEHGRDRAIELIACPGLVECVERAEFDAAPTRRLLESYLRPALARGADCIVLGCTHYTFLRSPIEELSGPSVRIFDPAPAVARELARRAGVGAFADAGRPSASERFFSSAPSPRTEALLSRLWGRRLQVEALA